MWSKKISLWFLKLTVLLVLCVGVLQGVVAHAAIFVRKLRKIWKDNELVPLFSYKSFWIVFKIISQVTSLFHFSNPYMHLFTPLFFLNLGNTKSHISMLNGTLRITTLHYTYSCQTYSKYIFYKFYYIVFYIF